MIQKICSRCDKMRNLDKYRKCAKAKDGLKSECKVCNGKDYIGTKLGNRVKINQSDGMSFKQRHGIAYSTFHGWVLREHAKGNLSFDSIKRVPIEQRGRYVDNYKQWRDEKNAKRKRL